MSVKDTVYLCPAHGAGLGECCKEAEDMGWMEYKGARVAEDQD